MRILPLNLTLHGLNHRSRIGGALYIMHYMLKCYYSSSFISSRYYSMYGIVDKRSKIWNTFPFYKKVNKTPRHDHWPNVVCYFYKHQSRKNSRHSDNARVDLDGVLKKIIISRRKVLCLDMVKTFTASCSGLADFFKKYHLHRSVLGLTYFQIVFREQLLMLFYMIKL